MSFRINLKRAPLYGAFFLLNIWQNTHAELCQAPETTEPVQVRYVQDGDTVTLHDGRRVRLIGINTPEIATPGSPASPLAIKARNRLRQLLFQSNQQAQLLIGREKLDPHGRTLATLWLKDGSNVGAALLREGLGWSIAIPPNIRLLDCYQNAEESARRANKGVWNQAEYKIATSNQLKLRSARGFLLVTGRVVRINDDSNGRWIHLQGHFAVRIPKSDFKWFPSLPDQSLLGRSLEVRGWVYAKKGELRVTAHHPAALRVY